MTSLQLHSDLVKRLADVGIHASKPQRRNIALLCVALAMSPNCHLGTLALYLPIPGQRVSLIQRLRRLLTNIRVRPMECYLPIVQHIFAHWNGREVGLIMDRTDIRDRWSVLMLGAAYRKRVLPLVWSIAPFGGTSAAQQNALLHRIQPYLPSQDTVRVHFFGDSEFRSVRVQQTAQTYGWHWHVGLKGDIFFHPGNERWRKLQTIALRPGQRRYFQDVWITQAHAFGPVNLIAYWLDDDDHPRYWCLDQPAEKQSWRRGRKRFWIEPTFRDWKSYGFDLERTQIDDPLRLDRLLLAIAITTTWLIHIGDWLTQKGRRYLLEARHKRDYSIFRLGRDHIQRARTLNTHIPIGFTVSHVS